MIVALAVALGALAQSVSGIGFVLVCGPVLVAALGPSEGVRLAMLLSAVVNVAILLRQHRAASVPSALSLFVPAALATPLLANLILDAPERLAKALAGAAAVAGATALAVGVRWRAAQGRWGAVLAGVVSAAMNVAAGIGGPAVALYADNAGWSPEKSRSTLQVYFLALNLVGLASLGLPHQTAGDLATAGLALLVGLGIGHAAAGRVTATVARRTTLSLAAAGGLLVLTSAALG